MYDNEKAQKAKNEFCEHMKGLCKVMAENEALMLTEMAIDKDFRELIEISLFMLRDSVNMASEVAVHFDL